MNPKELRKYMGKIQGYINADGIVGKLAKNAGWVACTVAGSLSNNITGGLSFSGSGSW